MLLERKIRPLETMEAYKRWVRTNRDFVRQLGSLINVSPLLSSLLFHIFIYRIIDSVAHVFLFVRTTKLFWV